MANEQGRASDYAITSASNECDWPDCFTAHDLKKGGRKQDDRNRHRPPRRRRVCSALGDEARLEFSVLEDTVNVAAGLEQEDQDGGLRLVVSRDFLVAAARKRMVGSGGRSPFCTLRGRARTVDLLGALPFGHGPATGAEGAVALVG
jgi:hypothetical protein